MPACANVHQIGRRQNAPIACGNGKRESNSYFGISSKPQLRNVGFVVDRPLWQPLCDRQDAGDKIYDTNEADNIPIVHHIESDDDRSLALKFSEGLLPVSGSQPDVFQADSGSMSGIKLIASKLELDLAGVIEPDSSYPQTNSRKRQDESEHGDRIARRLLPKGFAFLCLAAGLLGGFVTSILLLLGRRV